MKFPEFLRFLPAKRHVYWLGGGGGRGVPAFDPSEKTTLNFLISNSKHFYSNSTDFKRIFMYYFGGEMLE
jgi:hypothetical protein